MVGTTYTTGAITEDCTVIVTFPPGNTVGGTISGLSGTVVLQDNGADDLTTSNNGSFTFNTPLYEDAPYSVTVLDEPSGQSCLVSNGSGISSDDVTNITVTCSTDDGPRRTSGAPVGTLTKGTDRATLALMTDANATCKFDTSAGVDYASMGNTFTTTGGTSHSYSLTGLDDGKTYNYYVKCLDSSSSDINSVDYVITFNVASSSDSGSSHDNGSSKEKAPPAKRVIFDSPKIVSRGKILIQTGKRFSKNSTVALYFSRPNTTFYPPMTVHTTSSGSFSISYLVTKKTGHYKWYAVDLKTGKHSKMVHYTVR